MPSPRVRTRPTVLVPLRHRASFLEQFFPADGAGGILVPGTLAYEPGEAVNLELNFLQEQRTFRLRGVVQFRQEPPGPTTPGQLGIAFVDEDRPVRDLVMDFARGKEISFVERSDTRFPVALQISYQADSAFITDWTDDVSQGGAFIVCGRQLPLGTILPLRIRVPGSLLPLRLKGVVCWARRSAPVGVGVKFLFGSDRQRRKMAALVQRMKAEVIAQVQERAAAGRRTTRPPTGESG